MQKLTAMFNIFVGIFRGVVVRFRKLGTQTNAPQRRNTLQTVAIEVREGQAAAAWRIAQGAAASSRIIAVMARVRAEANLRSNLETTFREEIPCLDLRPLFMVPRSSSQIFLTFVSPHKISRC